MVNVYSCVIDCNVYPVTMENIGKILSNDEVWMGSTGSNIFEISKARFISTCTNISDMYLRYSLEGVTVQNLDHLINGTDLSVSILQKKQQMNKEIKRKVKCGIKTLALHV